MLSQKTLPVCAWAASTGPQILFDQLPSKIDGGIPHLYALVCRLAFTATPDAVNSDPANQMIRVIQSIIIRDHLGNECVNLQGHQLRTFIPFLCRRRHFADPAAGLVGGGGATPIVVDFYIPFHGGPGGIAGFSEFKDVIQPVDRFRGGSIQVNWSPALAWGAAHGTVTVGSLTVVAHMVVRGDLYQGADVRLRTHLEGDAQFLRVSPLGLKCLALAVTNTDLDHVDYTAVTIPGGYATAEGTVARIRSYNAEIADAAQQISLTAPELLPLIWTHPGLGLTSLLGLPSPCQIDLTNTHAAAQIAAIAEVHSRRILENALVRGHQNDAYSGVQINKPGYSKKNRGAVAGAKSIVCETLLGARLS